MSWPQSANEWLPYAIEFAWQPVLWRLSAYERIVDLSAELAQAGVRRAVSVAGRLEAVPGCFLNRLEFIRWFQEEVYVQARKALPETSLMQALLAQLPPEQRRLVVWLYALCPDARVLARLLGPDVSPRDAARAATATYNVFRATLTATFGEDDPAFPPPLGLESWFVPDADLDSSGPPITGEGEGE